MTSLSHVHEEASGFQSGIAIVEIMFLVTEDGFQIRPSLFRLKQHLPGEDTVDPAADAILGVIDE